MNETIYTPEYSMEHALRVLEFDHLREIVAGLADSPLGRGRLRALLPGSDPADVRDRLAETGAWMDLLRIDDPFPGLGVHDLSPLFPRLNVAGVVLDIEDIAAVAADLELARLVREYLDPRAERYPVLIAIAGNLAAHAPLEQAIRRVITPEMTIADDASPKLQSIRHHLVRARDALRTVVQDTLDGLPDDIVSERHITIRNGRLVIPVMDSMKRRVPGAVHDRSQTGKTVFIEPLVSIEGNNRVRELELEEEEEIRRILADLSARIAEVREDIAANQDILTRMDDGKARARYGIRVAGSVPAILDGPSFRLREARHPILDWKWRMEGRGRTVVPLDISLGGENATIVVTGPNAGGKTVTLKTVGLIIAMALSGLPVPAREGTEVGVFRDLFADIGDEQSIENDLSTFSSHMRHLVAILKSAGAGSLVLLDELGGGTNPDDGAALAVSVLENLTGSGALSIATTHLGALKVFAHDTPCVLNASMQFDTERLTPTFVFLTGVPGSSYAFEIAARLGMPPAVLDRAELLAGGERKTLEGLIAEMEEHRRLADEERRAAELARIETEGIRRDFETRRDEIKKRRTELMAEAVADARKLVTDINRRIETSIKSIRDTEADRETVSAARQEAVEITRRIEEEAARLPVKEQRKRPARVLEPGRRVWVDSLASDAVVEELLDNGRRARVRVGRSAAAVVVPAKTLFEPEAPEPAAPQSSGGVRVRSDAPESNEIDIRGMTFDEAEPALDAFLDGLHLAGMETGCIIHGKGTGALRDKVRGYLDRHRHVESHRLGYWNEGSSGVTVVTLK